MTPNRVLLIRTSALGDVVHALPVLTALRRHLPDARIGWLVESAMVPLLQGHPDLDELLVVRLRVWRRQPLASRTLSELRSFFSQLDRFAPDVVLDLMGNHKAGILAALTLADRKIGLQRSFRREPSSAVWISEPVRPNGKHAVDRALSLLEGVGLPTEPADFGPQKILREEPEEALALAEQSSEARLLIQPGAGWVNKRYPPESWGEVARMLARSPGLRSWVVAGPGEAELADAVSRASGGAADAISAPDLPFLATLLRRAALVMGGDTGPVHLAHALGTPVLCLMGPTDPQCNGPYREPEAALWRQLPCSFCHKRFAEPKLCLLDLSPQEVADKARRLLNRASDNLSK